MIRPTNVLVACPRASRTEPEARSRLGTALPRLRLTPRPSSSFMRDDDAVGGACGRGRGDVDPRGMHPGWPAVPCAEQRSHDRRRDAHDGRWRGRRCGDAHDRRYRGGADRRSTRQADGLREGFGTNRRGGSSVPSRRHSQRGVLLPVRDGPVPRRLLHCSRPFVPTHRNRFPGLVHDFGPRVPAILHPHRR